ncbi:uncharacterized protein LOC109598307 [Aethina tumida]|uniref:uncharacterized protein LOC109598307 n=1 Tax=Aethina tumida TaxID=116153 RepID=UPI002148A530|nr:uncharacterized protein LOC109598307 [Aethina tumida]
MLLKMKLTIVVLVLATCLTCEASVAIIPNDPDYKGIGCYTKTYDLGEFETGETKRVPSQCAIAICNKNFIDYIGCGVVAVEPPCSVHPGDLAKPHPQCCHEIRCPEDNKL